MLTVFGDVSAHVPFLSDCLFGVLSCLLSYDRFLTTDSLSSKIILDIGKDDSVTLRPPAPLSQFLTSLLPSTAVGYSSKPRNDVITSQLHCRHFSDHTPGFLDVICLLFFSIQVLPLAIPASCIGHLNAFSFFSSGAIPWPLLPLWWPWEFLRTAQVYLWGLSTQRSRQAPLDLIHHWPSIGDRRSLCLQGRQLLVHGGFSVCLEWVNEWMDNWVNDSLRLVMLCAGEKWVHAVFSTQ